MTSLAYLGLRSQEMQDWPQFAGLIGAEVETKDGEVRLRLDQKPHRIIVQQGETDEIAFLGFDLGDPDSLEQAAAALKGVGAQFTKASADECARRGVEHLTRTRDPNGVDIELVCGFSDGKGKVGANLRHGFAADGTGFGHVLVKVGDLEACRTFYQAFGGSLSDRIVLEGKGPKAEIAFVHFNPRHHSVALMQGDVGSSRILQHFMIEMRDIVDVGMTCDRLAAGRFGIAQTLGQHTNDRSVSFYCKTPAKFWLEIGCMPIRIEDEAEWNAGLYHTTSDWGHRLVPAK